MPVFEGRRHTFTFFPFANSYNETKKAHFSVWNIANVEAAAFKKHKTYISIANLKFLVTNP
jgi:hypothetical protein